MNVMEEKIPPAPLYKWGKFIFFQVCSLFLFFCDEKRKSEPKKKNTQKFLNLFQDLRNFFTVLLAIAATPHARMKTLRRLRTTSLTRDVNHIPSPLEADLRTD